MQHPDEGTIHAWLDGALGSDEARALEAHVAGCEQCAAAVTEARGLLAASSRILLALDSVPGGVLPAAAAEAASDERVLPIGRSSRWRSPGWRAAAAIVIVGGVSWLATRSVQRAEDRVPALQGAVATASSDTTTAASPPRAMADTTVQRAQGGATGERPQGAASRAEPPQVIAAPRAMAFATTKPGAVPNAGAIGSGAGAEEKVAVAAAPPVTPAPYASAEVSGNALREESRVADAAASAMRAPAAQARLKSSVAAGSASGASGASSAPALLQAQSMPDAALERLAGCYLIENAASHANAPATSAAAGLIPAQVQLLRDRDPSAGGNWRILRPAPGAAPFRLAATARWVMLTADSVRFDLQEGIESVSARFGVRGDSINGYATVRVPQLPTGEMGTRLSGSRIRCGAP